MRTPAIRRGLSAGSKKTVRSQSSKKKVLSPKSKAGSILSNKSSQKVNFVNDDSKALKIVFKENNLLTQNSVLLQEKCENL
jgi:hypothetical protein